MARSEATNKPTASVLPVELGDYRNSSEWQALSESEKSVLSHNFSSKVDYNKKRHTVEELVDTAKKLGLDDKHDDIPGLLDSGLVLLVYRIQQSFNSDAWYLRDGLYGPLTEREVVKKLSGHTASGHSEDVGGRLIDKSRDSGPEKVSNSPDSPQNPDIILSLGCGNWRRNTNRAKTTISLAKYYPSALLIASGGCPSRAFASRGTTEAAEQQRIWEKEGLPNPMDPEDASNTTAENIRNSWPKIEKVGELKKDIELTIVTDEAIHAEAAKSSLMRYYSAYVRRHGRQFNFRITICIQPVTEKPAIAIARPPETSNGSKSIDYYDRQCRHEATADLPYRYVRRHVKNGDLKFDVQNGGLPGYKAPGRLESNYRVSEAKNLIQHGTKAFVSVDGISQMDSALRDAASATGKEFIKITKSNLGDLQSAIDRAKSGRVIISLQWVFNISSLTDSNKQLIDVVASLFNNGISSYIHCKHGAHRGPAITAMASLESGLATNFRDAVDFAGIEADVDQGKLGPYGQTSDTRKVLCQLIRYSVEKYGQQSVSVACQDFYRHYSS